MKIGDKFNYGFWDSRTIPVILHKLIDGYPSEFKVEKTIPFLCKKDAIITFDEAERAEMKEFCEGNYKSVKEFFNKG